MHDRIRTGIIVFAATAAWSAHALGAVSSSSSVVLTPNTIAGAAPPVTLGNTTFTNLGLQGVGRVDAAFRDAFGETFGSVSSLLEPASSEPSVGSTRTARRQCRRSACGDL